MNFLTRDPGIEPSRTLLELHQVQSLLLLLAIMILTFLVFHLLRSAPPSQDDTYRAGKN